MPSRRFKVVVGLWNFSVDVTLKESNSSTQTIICTHWKKEGGMVLLIVQVEPYADNRTQSTHKDKHRAHARRPVSPDPITKRKRTGSTTWRLGAKPWPSLQETPNLSVFPLQWGLLLVCVSEKSTLVTLCHLPRHSKVKGGTHTVMQYYKIQWIKNNFMIKHFSLFFPVWHKIEDRRLVYIIDIEAIDLLLTMFILCFHSTRCLKWPCNTKAKVCFG